MLFLDFKDNLVTEAGRLSQFIINMQLERAMVSLSVFLDARSGKTTDLAKFYADTDKAIQVQYGEAILAPSVFWGFSGRVEYPLLSESPVGTLKDID